jgi:hypothetical protein
MAKPIKILGAKQTGDNCLIVMFSDGTTTAYSVEELLKLRPHRDRTDPDERKPN